MYSFSVIKQMVLEKYRDLHRVYFDLTQAPLLFYADLDDRQQKALLVENCCEHILNWRRTITFQFTSQAGAQQHQAKPPEESLLGMCKSFCIEVGNKTPMLDKLLTIAGICKATSKNFAFYLANVFQRPATLDYHMIQSQLAQRKLP